MAGEIGAVAGTVDQGGTFLPALPAGMPPISSLASNVFFAAVVLLVLSGLWRLAPRLWRQAEEGILSNWRLALLATTGLVLSLASGWTTWDGMRNFTNEPVLSLMITFGIQGVMLIIAWLIGESFASGMHQQAAGLPKGTISRGVQAALGGAIGIMLFALVMLLMLSRSPIEALAGLSIGSQHVLKSSDQLLIILVGLLMAALVALYSASDIVKPYLQSSRVILKNAILWVMFLACMATSVFFSFDSLFSAIFPQAERVRAAELRAQNQVSGLIADIGDTIERGRLSAADELFRSEGWAHYEGELDRLTGAARGAEGLIEAYYVQRMEERRSAIAEQHERIATAESSKAGLAIKKASLTEELSRLEAERPGLVADLQNRRSELDARAREVDAKRVEAMAEDKGVEGSLKVGKGPIYRERMGELSKLQDYYKIGEQRVKDADKRVQDINRRIDALKRELAGIDGSLAKLEGEATTAQQRISAAETSAAGEDGPKVDPARVLPAFENARLEFRQQPEAGRLASLQEQCTQLLNAMTSTPATKERVKGIDCDPKRAQEAGAALFALNTGAIAFGQNCVGGDKLAQHTTADSLFEFSRRCLADSGLASKDTDTLRQRINFIELNRDDKAHRFVVTWNAFEDGNRLAYLALAIAIAIDGLIFMSGLFGANAVRSPLSDVPSHKARSAQQLEAIIENALLPDTFETARLTLKSMRPITNVEGYMAEVRPERLDPHSAERVSGVLNAGATIHAVTLDHENNRYLVRAELFEFLSTVSKKAYAAKAEHADMAELEKIVAVALLPDISANADIVLSHIHPISESHGFTGEAKLSEVAAEHIRTVRNTLNAGAVLQRVQRAAETSDHYFIHRDLFKTLALLRARSLFSGSFGAPRIAAPSEEAPDAIYGGALDSAPARLTHVPEAVADAERRVAPRADAGLSDPQASLTPSPPSLERATIRHQLMMAMGFAPSAYRDLAQNGSLVVADAAAQELRRLCRNVRSLGAHVETEIADLRSDLDRAAEVLKLERSDAAIVDSVRDEIAAILPALLLIQGGRYQAILNNFIANLEDQDGAGELDNSERLLLAKLRQHENALSKLPRSAPRDWHRVADLLETFGSEWASGDPGDDDRTNGRRST